jgi:hypothetical protein
VGKRKRKLKMETLEDELFSVVEELDQDAYEKFLAGEMSAADLRASYARIREWTECTRRLHSACQRPRFIRA